MQLGRRFPSSSAFVAAAAGTPFEEGLRDIKEGFRDVYEGLDDIASVYAGLGYGHMQDYDQSHDGWLA